MKMQEKSYPNSYPISTLLREDFLVSLFQLPDKGKDLKIPEERCSLKLQELLPLKDLSICSLKMYPDSLVITKAGHLKQSSVRCTNWGMMSYGKCLTAKISEFRNQEKDCILSDFIEKNVPDKYYLSRRQILKLLYKDTQAKKVTAYIPQKEQVLH